MIIFKGYNYFIHIKRFKVQLVFESFVLFFIPVIYYSFLLFFSLILRSSSCTVIVGNIQPIPVEFPNPLID